ncbi:MAG: hypothetical protein ABI434_02265 [Burkholderiaceae bacterium]
MRVATPSSARENGATHVVIGRSITRASNPREAFAHAWAGFQPPSGAEPLAEWPLLAGPCRLTGAEANIGQSIDDIGASACPGDVGNLATRLARRQGGLKRVLGCHLIASLCPHRHFVRVVELTCRCKCTIAISFCARIWRCIRHKGVT